MNNLAHLNCEMDKEMIVWCEGVKTQGWKFCSQIQIPSVYYLIELRRAGLNVLISCEALTLYIGLCARASFNQKAVLLSPYQGQGNLKQL